MTCASDACWYLLFCRQCTAQGAAEWWASSGGSIEHRAVWGLNLSYRFLWLPGFDDDRLICDGCGADVDVVEVSYAEFHSVERQVAGDDCESMAIEVLHGKTAEGTRR